MAIIKTRLLMCHFSETYPTEGSVFHTWRDESDTLTHM